MSIKYYLEKVKPFYTLILILLVAGLFFALGRLSALEDRYTPIKIEYPNATSTTAVIETAGIPSQTVSGPATGTAAPAEGQSDAVVGSKSGKKYYFPWCGTVSRIKPENQVHFGSIAEAKAAGFTPGGNCKGLN